MNQEELKLRLTPEEIAHLNEQWELDYEDAEMTDAEWELKRWSLIADAQLRKLKDVYIKVEIPLPSLGIMIGCDVSCHREEREVMLQWVKESYRWMGETK